MARQVKTFSNLMGMLVAVLFLSIFVVVGIATFVGMYALPTWRMMQADSWPKTTAVIDKSEIAHHRGDNSVTYTPDIQYHYIVEGQNYEGERFWFRTSNVNDLKTLEVTMKPYTVGTEVDCFYDPENPSSSVLVPRTNLGWSVIFLPLIFVLIPVFMIGFVVLAYSGQNAKKSVSARKHVRDSSSATQSFANTQRDVSPMSANSQAVYESEYCPTESTDLHNDQPFVMKTPSSPLGVFLGVCFVAAIWNGITNAILYAIIHEGKSGWFPLLFMIPFELIGFLLIGIGFYNFLKLFNPRPTLVCSNSLLYPGSEFELSWTFSGRSKSLQDLRVVLIGIESATYRHGTSTRTETNEFHRQELFHTTDPSQIAEGFTLAKIPDDLMYTFNGSRNQVQWYTELKAEIKRWPDVSERFEITIYPPKLLADSNAQPII